MNDCAVSVLCLEFLPGGQARLLPHRFRNYDSSGGIDGSFHTMNFTIVSPYGFSL